MRIELHTEKRKESCLFGCKKRPFNQVKTLLFEDYNALKAQIFVPNEPINVQVNEPLKIESFLEFEFLYQPYFRQKERRDDGL